MVKIGNAGAKNGEHWDCEDVFGKVRHTALAGDQALTLPRKKDELKKKSLEALKSAADGLDCAV